MSIEDLGLPLGNAFAIAGGQARLYERGLSITGTVSAEVRFAFPMIGKPDIVTGNAPWRASAPVLRFDPHGTPVEPIAAAIYEAVANRFALTAVGQATNRIPLVFAEAQPLFEATSPPYGMGAEMNGGELQHRQLYDVSVRGDDDRWHVIGPHAVYGRHSWSDFGIAHITDMHVARRIDSFRQILRDAGRADAAALMYNWNDRFRGFVRYANYLYDTGVLDLIVTTGDNYDYQFEKDDDRSGGGNAAFLRDLILGKAPGPDFADVEELRVPIFMVPGNHDYRINPYHLVFDLHVSDALSRAAMAAAAVLVGAGAGAAGAIIAAELAGLLINQDWKRIPSYSGYRLSTDDAVILDHGGTGGAVRNLQPDEAAEAVEYDESNRPYAMCLAPSGSYVLELGPHRIAMIDSAHDEGTVTEELAGILVKLGFGNEDQNAFVGASPNCRGVTPEALARVSRALDDNQATGLFIAGLHAPLFNPPFDGYSYFLRETQRASQGDQPHAFLASHQTTIAPGSTLGEVIEKQHPTWFVAHDSNVRDHKPPRYVKRVSGVDSFDAGVSRGEAEQLMKVLAGIGSRRAADLVLAGHTHAHNEYSVRKDSFSGELAYYFDFYTENPANYYRTDFKRRYVQEPSIPNGWNVEKDETYIEVSPYAKPDATPWPMPFAALTKNMLQVPPYANPLNSASDPQAWWAEHRPLVVQTGALGPLKQTEYFSGFRVIAVKNNVIDKMHFISSARLEEHQFRLPWEQAIAPEPGREYHYVERSRPFGAPLATDGVPSGISFPQIGANNVVYRAEDGHLHELWRKGDQAGTSDLTTLASNGAPAASDPSSYIDPIEGLEVALYRGTDQHIHSLYWSTGEVRRDALSQTAGAPKGSGVPIGYVGRDGFRHVIYRADDGHLEELWWTGPNPPGHGDITTKVGAPHCAGNPTAYQKPTTGENVVIYRGVDQHIHGLYWLTGDVRHDDLSGFAQAPMTDGNPAAYYTTHDDVHQIVYRGLDGHLHELYWKGNNPVSHWNLTASTPGAPAPAPGLSGDPVAYYAPGNNTKHVIYRSRDGHLNELSWVPGTATPTYIDLTAYAVAPLAADKPTAFVEASNTHYVAYRGNDHQIHEIRWSKPSTNLHPVRFPINDAVELTPQPTPVSRWHRATL